MCPFSYLCTINPYAGCPNASRALFVVIFFMVFPHISLLTGLLVLVCFCYILSQLWIMCYVEESLLSNKCVSVCVYGCVWVCVIVWEVNVQCGEKSLWAHCYVHYGWRETAEGYWDWCIAVWESLQGIKLQHPLERPWQPPHMLIRIGWPHLRQACEERASVFTRSGKQLSEAAGCCDSGWTIVLSIMLGYRNQLLNIILTQNSRFLSTNCYLKEASHTIQAKKSEEQYSVTNKHQISVYSWWGDHQLFITSSTISYY